MNYIACRADYKVDPKFRKEIIKVTKEISDILGMTGWHIDIKINKFPANHKASGSATCGADVNTNHIYQDTFINIYPEIYKNWKLNLEKYIIQFAVAHELVHCLLDKLNELAISRFVEADELREEVENKTQLFSRLICKLFYDITEDKYTNTNNTPIPSSKQYDDCDSKCGDKPRKNRKSHPRRQRKNRGPKNT